MREKIAIKIDNLTYQYDKSRKIINDVSLEIPEKTIVTILGKNGTGKTTLINCILGFIENYRGKIFFYDKEQTLYSKKELAQIIGLVPQLSQTTFDYTVDEFVLMGCNPSMGYFSVPDKSMQARVDEVLKILEISHLKYRLVNSLSGGERQLVYIARTLAQKPKIIVLDEPTSALDFGNSMKIIDLLIKLREKGYTLILTCHNPNFPFVFDGYTVAMLPENTVFFGKSENILTDELLSKLYGINVKRVLIEENNQYICIQDKSNSGKNSVECQFFTN